MKQAFIYVGSRMGKNSRTLKFINNVLDKVYKSVEGEEFKVNIYTADDINVKNCKGCTNCFLRGECALDEKDDMKIIKEKMLNSDIIFLASPVYAHHVSGDMKVFIDRISYWAHLMRLSGKVGIAVATSGGNGLDLTTNYIYKIMSYMGLKVVGRFGVDAYNIDDQYKNSVEECSKIVLEYINNKKIESDNILEAVFSATKNVIEMARDYKTAEFEYWDRSGLLKCNNFQEVLSMIN